MFVRILTAYKRGSMEGRAPASPFAPSSPKRPSLWRRRAPPSTDHASQWRGDLCEPIAPSQLKAPKFGRRSSLARRRRRYGDRRSLDTLARAVLLQRPDPISKQEQQTSSKPAESFSARALSSLSWLMHATRASRLQKRRVQRKGHASSRWKDYILTRRQSRELTTLRALNSFGLRSC